ncbi:hypothetical protein SUGI_1068270 [Cryptomeria japonica]|nr:hypothetical protein SUGI_1068270 [Cryptomeria japonica]
MVNSWPLFHWFCNVCIVILRVLKSIRWVSLEHGWIKCKFDGVAKGNPSRFGGGGIFCDDMGSPKLFYSMDCGIESNNMVEARAGLWGIMIARDKGWRRLWIEGDSKLVIDALNGSLLRNWRLAMIMDATKYVLSGMEEIMIFHIGR